MYRKYTGVLALLGLLSLAAGYRITSNVMDGVPKFININPAPFVKIGDGYYYIETKLESNWFDAYEACRRMGAELIAFETIEEWDLVNKYLIKNNIYAIYWTSGNDLANEGKHVWHSTGEPLTLKIWYPGEPNHQNGEGQCDELGYRGTSTNYNVLNDRRCSFKSRYICEAPQPRTASFIIW
ncbi:C-type lectin 37Da [Drosophila obscura]|uniref:C-type lectin 37Da n=1 Tax=Drosophila obscura TaxID=7282 RepID=UPI001BB1473F|nr:C-type lectin 37Da [Drosophila obscura]